MSLDHTAFQDQITNVLDFWQNKKEVDKLKTPDREKILGLKFVPGQIVLDTITNEEVQIAGGIRELVGFQSTPG
jgi:hypothetical protein